MGRSVEYAKAVLHHPPRYAGAALVVFAAACQPASSTGRQTTTPPTATTDDHPLLAKRTSATVDGSNYRMERLEVRAGASTLRALARPMPTRRVDKALDDPSPVGELTTPIRNARLAPGGERMRTVYETFPAERQAAGLAAFTVEQIRGNGIQAPLCEVPHIDLEIEHPSGTLDARYEAGASFWHTEPLADLYALSSTCTAALLASQGNLSNAVDAGCAPEDAAAHFPAGSRCRACLTEDGDHARCVLDGACRTRMARSMQTFVDGRMRWVDIMRATNIGCAGGFYGETIYLTRDLGDDSAALRPFEHDIHKLCFQFWEPVSDAPALYCIDPPALFRGYIQFAWADVLIGRVQYIRRPGSEATPYNHRLFLGGAVQLDGHDFVGSPLYPGALAEVSDPEGWGYKPNGMRADGKDGARDYLAILALKTATTIDGVPIATYNRNICDDEDWKGPDAQGRHFCRIEAAPQDDLQWDYDWTAYNQGSGLDLHIYPLVTLGATGLFDPSIPGGHVPHVLGTPSLANPNWDNCAWPEMFVPDEVSNQDGLSFDPSTYTAQSYRFGKDPNLDLRVVLATNWRRGFCFEPLEDL